MRARLRLEGSFLIRCLAVMSFKRCTPDSVTLLLTFSMLLSPEHLNFGYSQLVLLLTQGKKGHTQKVDTHIIACGFLVHFWSRCPLRLSAKTQRRDGQCHTCSYRIPCNPSYPCPTPSSGVCLPWYLYHGQTMSMADHSMEKTLPHLVLPAVWKATHPAVLASLSFSTHGDAHP